MQGTKVFWQFLGKLASNESLDNLEVDKSQIMGANTTNSVAIEIRDRGLMQILFPKEES
jgi:hypothetical protein